MTLKDTCKTIKGLLEMIQHDLDKAEAGNKAAAQRVRTCTIKLEKAAKLYRKESVKAEKVGGGKKKPARKTAAPKKAKAAKSPVKPAAKPKKKTASKKKKATTKAMSRKRPTAKLLKKRK